MNVITTQVDIDAGVEVVWSFLTAFDQYPQWNPFLPRIAVDMKIGGTIDFEERRPGQDGVEYSSTVRYLDPGRKFGWPGGVARWQRRQTVCTLLARGSGFQQGGPIALRQTTMALAAIFEN